MRFGSSNYSLRKSQESTRTATHEEHKREDALRFVRPARDFVRGLPIGYLALRILESAIRVIESQIGRTLFVPIGAQQEVDTRSGTYSIQRYRALHLFDHFSPLPRIPDEPALYAFVASMGNRIVAMGADFFDRERALTKTLGETIERSASMQFAPSEVVRTSFAQLPSEGIAPSSYARVYQNDEPAITNETPLTWVLAQSEITAEKVWIPLQLLIPVQGETYMRPQLSTGTAAHTNRESAKIFGALEVIERDALMIAHMHGIPVPHIELASINDDKINQILEHAAKHRLEVTILSYPTDFPATIIGVIVIDRLGGPAVSMGMGAHWEPRMAIEKALTEAFATRLSTKLHFQSRLPSDDFSDLQKHVLLWAHPERIPLLSSLLAGPNMSYTSLSSFAVDGAAALKDIVTHCVQQQYAYTTLDITMSALKSEWSVIYSVIPPLVPFAIGSGIAIAGDRMRHPPRAFGNVLHRTPHPIPFA